MSENIESVVKMAYGESVINGGEKAWRRERGGWRRGEKQ